MNYDKDIIRSSSYGEFFLKGTNKKCPNFELKRFKLQRLFHKSLLGNFK